MSDVGWLLGLSVVLALNFPTSAGTSPACSSNRKADVLGSRQLLPFGRPWDLPSETMLLTRRQLRGGSGEVPSPLLPSLSEGGFALWVSAGTCGLVEPECGLPFSEGRCWALLGTAAQAQRPPAWGVARAVSGDVAQAGCVQPGLQLGREEQRLAAPGAYKGCEWTKEAQLWEKVGSAGACGWGGFGVKWWKIRAEVVIMETAVIPRWT